LRLPAGSAPSEALVFHLLGADRCVATDYNAIANLAQVADSAKAADRDRVLRALTPFAAGVDIEQRLDEILRAETNEARTTMFNLIDYVAPFDMSAGPMAPPFDFIHSTSVLEHVPRQAAHVIVGNLRRSLQRGGHMIHEIDLRDHLDMDGAPLAFLSRSDSYDPILHFDVRGNRILKCGWLEIFDTLPETETRLIYQSDLPADSLPGDLIDEVASLAPEDLLIGIIGISCHAAGP
jgi:hypothetical protein